MPYAFSDILAAVKGATSNPREQAVLLYACGAETNCQAINQYGGGPGRGPWQIETGPGGSSYGKYTDAQATNPATAAPLFYRFWNVAGCTAQQGTLWLTDPHQAEYLAARCAEGGGSNAANNVGAPYNSAQMAAGQHFADMVNMSTPTPNTTNTNLDVFGIPNPNIPGVGPLFPSGLTPQNPLQGIKDLGSGIGQIGGAISAIAQLIARTFDAFSSPDFWISVLLVVGGGWLFINGTGQLMLRGSASKVAGAA